MPVFIKRLLHFFELFVKALRGKDQDYTRGSIRKGIFLLAVPMIAEMMGEAAFAVVDVFFVSKVSIEAVAAVGLTESVITIVYAVAIGMSMGATAIISRRVGEKKWRKARDAAFQSIIIASVFSVMVGVAGYFYAADILRIMGAEESLIADGYKYTRILFAGNLSIMLLFLINGIFRGAGQASIAMWSLWLANGMNIILDPLFIFGWGPIPAFGVEGAAIATTVGRGTGVLFQIYLLLRPSNPIRINKKNMVLRWKTIRSFLDISAGGMGQFLIESASWVFLTRILADFGSTVLAGYTVAVRIVIFTLLPSWGFANAAATLVGQNLGADSPQRAETSVWYTAFYNVIFLFLVSVCFYLLGESIVAAFNPEPEVIAYGVKALKIFCLGYVFFALGMVISQSFNGAGDTRTPLWINVLSFWIVQLPLAWLLAYTFALGAEGVFITIAISHSFQSLVSVAIFRRGRWKLKQV